MLSCRWGQKVFRLKHLQVCVSPTDSSLSGVDLIHFDLIRFSVFFYPQKRSILSKWTNVQFWWYSNGNQLQFLIWPQWIFLFLKKKTTERTFLRTWFHRFPTWLSNTEKEFCQNGSLFGTFWPRNLWVFRFLCFFHAWLKSVKWNEL